MKLMCFFVFFAGLGVAFASAGISDHIVRQSIDGIDVIVLKTGVKNVVTLKGWMPAGNAASPESNPAVALLTGSMLDKGTTAHDQFAIAAQLENAGATLSFSVGTETLAINGRCLAKDVALVISLVAEQLRRPAFSAEEFAKLKTQWTGSLRRSLDDTDDRATNAFTRAIYPVGHPNRQPDTQELIAAIERTTLDEVKAFHAKYYGPAHLALVLVGDVDPAAIQIEVGQAFAGWTGGKPPETPVTYGSALDSAREETVFMADKTSVSITWGMATGLRYSDPDALPLRLATDVLGGGFTGRLMGNVRDKEGLTYGIYGLMAGDTLRDGDWRIWANFAPNLLEQGIASTRRELTKWYQEGITADELAKRKTGFIGEYKVSLATSSGMATAIMNTIQRGYDLDRLDLYPAAVESVTLDQVNQAIKTHLDPDKMVLIKAGTVREVTAQ